MSTTLRRVLGGCLLVFLCAGQSVTRADDGDDLRIFGYFQTEFQQERPDSGPRTSYFVVQHLNLFFQKDLARNWTSFLNFEFTNSFSANKNWGTLDIQEAWVRYRYDNRFNLKLGLQIPIFNNLNEIKNRTPILPYIIRPIAYESSLEEIVPIDQYVPNRAYIQASGFFPFSGFKFDYAAYIGNSPNINGDPNNGQTGIDTTDTFLFGGRVGIRRDELKLGVSSTYDRSNLLFDIVQQSLGEEADRRQLGRLRLGADVSYRWRALFFESEVISVTYDDAGPDIDLNLTFFYATLGCEISERWTAYASYWQTRERIFADVFDPMSFNPLHIDQEFGIQIPTIGLASRINDQVTLKAQWARVTIELEGDGFERVANSHHIAFAVSAFF